MTISFTKMHGIGNDYVYLDGVSDDHVRSMSAAQISRLAVAISDRHTGVGSDGLILVLPPEEQVDADVRMRMWNADGSESEMCGNGIRCVAKYAFDHAITKSKPMRVQTGAGVLSIDYELDRSGRVARATVDMGAPILEIDRVPVHGSELAWSRPPLHAITFDEGSAREWAGVAVSMGNPHIVFFDRDNSQIGQETLAGLDLARLGPTIEHHPAFPRRVNAHFVKVHSRREVTMRTWERGAGTTMACGTGACAVCVAGVLADLTDRTILAHLPGGDLTLRWDEKSGHVFKTGPAVEVFSGVWPE